MSSRHAVLAVLFVAATAVASFAQTVEPTPRPTPTPLMLAFPDPKAEPRLVTPGRNPGEPPSDAVVLFDGKDLSRWRSGKEGVTDPPWLVQDGYMEVVRRTGDIVTRDEFGDCQIHLEWASPAEVKGEGQSRGNSGVMLMGRYEVQILDSYENKTYAHGQAASVYKQYAPLVNASRKPGEWQTYDIVFRAPRFDDDGKVVQRARVTVFHNGVLVQNDVEIYGVTDQYAPAYYTAHGPKAPLRLQNHGNPVRYRNVWIRPLS
jgi:hypothetical protein